jgi:hypothetical protein
LIINQLKPYDMKTTKIILMFIMFSVMTIFNIQAQTPGFEWAGQMGGDSLIQATSIAVDTAGNQIIIGYFKGTADFDPDTNSTFYLTAKGYSDIFIQKLDAGGGLLWAAGIGDTMNRSEWGAEVVTDAAGNIYAIGHFWGTADVDPGEGEYFLSQNRWTTMVLKINPDGDLIWGKQMGSETAGHAYGNSIAVDNNGNVITAGSFYGRVDFDPGPGVVNLTCTSNDGFVQKLDANGNFIWVKQIIGTDYKIPYSMATDASGNIYTSGYFKGTVDFNPDKKLKYNLTSFGDYDGFILKLTGNGNFVWAKQIGGTAQEGIYSLTLDPFGNLYTTGYFYGTADFNPGSGTFNMTPAGGDDAFILKLDLSGNFIWAKQLGGPSWDGGFEIATDIDGNVYVSGFFHSTADFDPGSGTHYLTSNGYDDSFVFKSDPDGNLLWVTQTGGPGWDYGLALALDASGNIFNVGNFAETADFDPSGNAEFELTNSGAQDMFVQKLNPSGGDNCPVPNGLTATNITESSADLSWNEVTGATGYYVRYREITNDWIVAADMVPGTSLTISDLTSATAYEFQVKTDCYSNYSYSLEFITSGGSCPDNYEPNETMGAAAPIPVNADITALIGAYGDHDWFSFSTTQAAKNIHITLTNLPANYNVKLYKSNGTLIGSSSSTGTAPESIIYNTPKTGTYYIWVYGYSGVYDPVNCYTLKAATSSTGYKLAEAEIADNEENGGLAIYPNPARNILNIDLTSAVTGGSKVALISTSGQTVLVKEFKVIEGPNHYSFDLTGIANGLYMMQLNINGETLHQKIMIHH